MPGVRAAWLPGAAAVVVLLLALAFVLMARSSAPPASAPPPTPTVTLAERERMIDALPEVVWDVSEHVRLKRLEPLVSVAKFVPLKCIESPPASASGRAALLTAPVCPPGVTVDTAIGRFVVQGCGQGVQADARPYLDELLPRLGTLYAVVVPAADDDWPEGWPVGDYGLIFSPAPGQSPTSAAAIYVEGGLIARVRACATPQQLMRANLTGAPLQVLVPPP